MNAISFLDKLRRLQLFAFTVINAQQILNKPKEYVRTYLYRLEKKGIILRIERNKYALKNMNPILILNTITAPYYVSFLFSLYTHNLTTQIPIKIQVVSTISKKPLVFENHEFEFIRFRPSRVFGYYRHTLGDGYVFIADKEKTLIDCLYLQKGVSASDVNFAISDCNIKKLIKYATRMNSQAVVQRLGYLLELNKNKLPNHFKKLIGKNYILLNPALPKKGLKNKNWRIIINEVLE